jgi:hypothetical protein
VRFYKEEEKNDSEFAKKVRRAGPHPGGLVYGSSTPANITTSSLHTFTNGSPCTA